MRADELLAKLLPEVTRRTEVEPNEIDDFLICGSAVRFGQGVASIIEREAYDG